jgi:hypothetical protein
MPLPALSPAAKWAKSERLFLIRTILASIKTFFPVMLRILQKGIWRPDSAGREIDKREHLV